MAVEVRRTPNGCAQKPGETPTLAQPRRDGALPAVQTPNSGKSGNETVSRGHQKDAQPWSGNAPLATRLSITGVSRGIASRVSLPFQTWLYESPFILAQVPAVAVPGKRFILFDDDDDDDDDEL